MHRKVKKSRRKSEQNLRNWRQNVKKLPDTEVWKSFRIQKSIRLHREGCPVCERQTYFSLFSLTFGFYINPFWPSRRQAWSPSFSLFSFYLKASSWNNKSLKRALFGPSPRTRNQCANDLSKEKIRAPLAGNTWTLSEMIQGYMNFSKPRIFSLKMRLFYKNFHVFSNLYVFENIFLSSIFCFLFQDLFIEKRGNVASSFFSSLLAIECFDVATSSL